MRIRKTRQDKRATYKYETYVVEDRNVYSKECIELVPGKDGVTEAWIKLLHSLDDSEVYYNLKNGHPPLTKEEKQMKREWEEEHPGEVYWKNWNVSLDSLVFEDGHQDKSVLLAEVSYSMEEEVSADVEHLRDVVEMLTDKQKQVYTLHVLEGYSFTEIAKMMKTSVPNVTKHFGKAKEYIRKNF